jgi:hypothetical protein
MGLEVRKAHLNFLAFRLLSLFGYAARGIVKISRMTDVVEKADF